MSLSTAYAIGDVLALRHSLHRKVTEAKGFYAVYCRLIAVAAALVLTPDAPLGLLTDAVQTLAGVLLPSATVFLLLLCNDKAVLGPWVNGALAQLVHRRGDRRAGHAVGDPDRLGAVPGHDKRPNDGRAGLRRVRDLSGDGRRASSIHWAAVEEGGAGPRRSGIRRHGQRSGACRRCGRCRREAALLSRVPG